MIASVVLSALQVMIAIQISVLWELRNGWKARLMRMTNGDKFRRDIAKKSNAELVNLLTSSACSYCTYREIPCIGKSCGDGVGAWLDRSINNPRKKSKSLTAYRHVYDNGRIECPKCSREFIWGYYDGEGYDEIHHCPYCGQRINVVDTEE